LACELFGRRASSVWLRTDAHGLPCRGAARRNRSQGWGRAELGGRPRGCEQPRRAPPHPQPCTPARRMGVPVVVSRACRDRAGTSAAAVSTSGIRPTARTASPP